jgi:hypothetical protein
MILAAGVVAGFVEGRTDRTDGATPKEHIIMAPAVTRIEGIMILGLRIGRGIRR